ncbi:IclR family transcriptional regulator [Kitasatospora sp. LaBMicrA B282]|uniref:IclR family transcriptional regulator n=1 Tax=Kitasatospora sp. LaBMicrA B282 TaxID=3420949 RepID=UPI003D09D818
MDVARQDPEQLDSIPPPARGRGVLEGAFLLLEEIERAGDCGLSALALRAGLPKSTARRLLEQLVELGAVERIGDLYRMGPRIFRFGRKWQPPPLLLAAAQEPVRLLARSTGATVGLCVLHGGQVMAVAGVPGEVDRLAPFRPGTTWPWTTAAGKVLVAFGDARAAGSPPPASWAREAAQIRASGVATERERTVQGVSCAAAPVRNRQRQVVAALFALVDARRELSAVAERVRDAAARISTSLAS